MSGVSKRKIERAVRKLMPLSDVAQKLLRAANDPECDGASIVRIIEADAALTVRVLQMANSPVVAPVSPIESVQHAVASLGENAIVATALSIGAAWLREPLDGYGPEARIYENGVKTAVAAGLIAKKAGRHELASCAYTGGLLHDIGKTVLSDFLVPSVSAVIADVTSGRASDWLAAERAELGFDHCEVGAMVADHFELGPALRAVIAHHHDPSGADPEHRLLVEFVHAADGVRAMIGGDGSADTLSYPVDTLVLDNLGIGIAELSEIMCETLAESRPMLDAVLAD